MKVMKDFNGAVLRKDRILKGFSKKELADKVGVCEQSITNWESGATKPKLDKVRELDFIFGVKDDHWTPVFSAYDQVDMSKRDVVMKLRETNNKLNDFTNKFNELLRRLDILEARVNELEVHDHRNEDVKENTEDVAILKIETQPSIDVNVNIKSELLDILGSVLTIKNVSKGEQ